MKCPLDKNDMIVIEYQNIELDYCVECEGIWFDSGELDLLVSKLQEDASGISYGDLLTPQIASVSETKRKCPVCGKKMDKAWIGNNPRVLIDSCPVGDGIWVDGGELHQIIRQLGHSESKDVISFLAEAFKSDNFS